MTDATGALPAWLPLSAFVFAVQMLVYHGVGLWFEWCDRTGRLSDFKTRPVERMSYFTLMPRVLANQFLILLPSMLAVQYLGLAFVGAPHLAWWHFLAAMAFMGVGHDIVQYVSHRVLLHRPTLMRKLGHSVHHTTSASRGISACYMSAADFFLEIVLPYLIPLVIVRAGADVGFHCLVAGLGAIGGLYEHAGYDFSLTHSARRGGPEGPLLRCAGWPRTSKAHAEHHRRGVVSFSDGFGSPGICDAVFATRWDLVAERVPTRTREAREEAAH